MSEGFMPLVTKKEDASSLLPIMLPGTNLFRSTQPNYGSSTFFNQTFDISTEPYSSYDTLFVVVIEGAEGSTVSGCAVTCCLVSSGTLHMITQMNLGNAETGVTLSGTSLTISAHGGRTYTWGVEIYGVSPP
jgi:hypothetical protein